MSEADTRSPRSDGPLRRALRWWALTGVFLLGLLVGAVVIGLLSAGSPEPPAIGSGEPVATDPEGEAGPTTGVPAGATGELVVNAACLRAINAAQDTVDVVEDLAEAVAEFNAARLDEIVRRLQPLQPRLTGNVEDCEVVGRVPSGTPAEETAATGSAATPSPASPTD